MKTNKEIINMHMRGKFDELSKPIQDAILSAMNESNSEAVLSSKNSCEHKKVYYCMKSGGSRCRKCNQIV